MSEWGNCWHFQNQWCATCLFSLKLFKLVHQGVLVSLLAFKVSVQSWPKAASILKSPAYYCANLLALSRASSGALQRLPPFVLQKPLASIFSGGSDALVLPAPLLVCKSLVSEFAMVETTGAFITILMLVCFNVFPSLMESLHVLKSLRLQYLHRPAGGEVFIKLHCPPALPPPLALLCLLLMKGLPAQTYSTPEGEHMLETTHRQSKSSQTGLPLQGYLFLQLRALWVWPRPGIKRLTVDMYATLAWRSSFLGFLLSFHLCFHLLVWAAMDSCYDEEGTPSRCMPKFENVAFNRTVVASNVCGSPPEEYCMQTGSTRSCHQCDAADPERSHNASLLTDFHRNEESTWWQSQSMYFGIQHPNSVNITLHLGKSPAWPHICAISIEHVGVSSC